MSTHTITARRPRYRYSAQFSDGNTIGIAKSGRDYSHAWQVRGHWDVNGLAIRITGFAKSLAHAERAATSTANRIMRIQQRAFNIDGPWVSCRAVLYPIDVVVVSRDAP